LLLAALVPASVHVVEILLAKGADPNASDLAGSTALQFAATKGGPEIARALLGTKKLKVDAQDSMGYSPILNAAHYGQRDVFKMLVQAKANLKLRTKEGKNAMHLCVQHNRLAVLQLLLDCEVFDLLEEKDASGQTPMDVATEMRNSEIMVYMQRACAGLGQAVNIGTEAGDGAKHFNEANKISLTRVVVPYPGVEAAQIGIRWDASKDWKGEGELTAALFGEKTEGEPDLTKVLGECKGKVSSTENRGQTVYYKFATPVALTKDKGYWIAFKTTTDTLVEKDSRLKAVNRRYAAHDFAKGWTDLPKAWKSNICTPAVFLRTAGKQGK